MLPHELPLERWTPPNPHPKTLVVLTGSELRHDRFALRVFERFGDRVLCWYRIESPDSGGVRQARDPLYRRVARQWSTARRDAGANAVLRQAPGLLSSYLERRRRIRRRIARQSEVERRLFGSEVERLRARIDRAPTVVRDPNGREFVKELSAKDPWLLLTLGGPLYRKRLLNAVRGAVLNQHAGWSPEYRGTNTTDWALYHRHLDFVGSTVHVSVTGADAGPILRRSNPALTDRDTPESIFARVVALGTELLLDTVQTLLDHGSVLAAKQPERTGRTYLSRDLSDSVLVRTARDFDSGWLRESLDRMQRW